MSRAVFRSHVIQAMSLVREGTGHVSELVSQRTGRGWEWEGGACVGPVPPGYKLVLRSSPGVP